MLLIRGVIEECMNYRIEAHLLTRCVGLVEVRNNSNVSFHTGDLYPNDHERQHRYPHAVLIHKTVYGSLSWMLQASVAVLQAPRWWCGEAQPAQAKMRGGHRQPQAPVHLTLLQC